MKQGATWYKREPRAFLDGVQGLGPELIGAYSVLIDLIYARAGESLRDDRHLAGILGCSTRKAKVLTDRLIETGKLTVHGQLITNSRAKSDAKSARDVSEVRASAGREGGKKSGTIRKNKGLAKANASSKTKHRLDKRRIDTPLPPKGDTDLFGNQGEVREPTTLSIISKVMPEKLAADWIRHRQEISKGSGQKFTVLAADRLVKKLSGRTDIEVLVNEAIEKGWKSIVLPEDRFGTVNGSGSKHFQDRPANQSELVRGVLKRQGGMT